MRKIKKLEKKRIKVKKLIGTIKTSFYPTDRRFLSDEMQLNRLLQNPTAGQLEGSRVRKRKLEKDRKDKENKKNKSKRKNSKIEIKNKNESKEQDKDKNKKYNDRKN